MPLATGNHIGATVDYMQGRNRYIASLIASANFSLQGVKIGIDCANGSASSVAKPVFDALGATCAWSMPRLMVLTSTSTAAPRIWSVCSATWWSRAWTWLCL